MQMYKIPTIGLEGNHTLTDYNDHVIKPSSKEQASLWGDYNLRHIDLRILHQI